MLLYTMVLSLANIAASRIQRGQALDERSRVVLENIKFTCSKKIQELKSHKEILQDQYIILNREYYDTLLSEESDADVFSCVNEMSRVHNDIIELRNFIAHNRLWSDNYVIMDSMISTYISWTSACAERQELLTICYGIFKHHSKIVLKDPTPVENSLMLLIEEYVHRAKFWYGIFNQGIDRTKLFDISRKMRDNNEKYEDIKSELYELNKVYGSICVTSSPSVMAMSEGS